MAKNHYVDNKSTYAALAEWKEELKTNPDAVVPDPVAIAIVKISNNLTRRYNFGGYTAAWKEEMVGDAIEHCLRYIKNFDTDKYNNPHAYITRICYNSFLQRLTKEHKQTAVKYRYFLMNVDEYSDEPVDYEFMQQMAERVNAYEKTSTNNKSERPRKNLEKFY